MKLLFWRKKGVTRDQVIWCYRTLLGREPESEAAIQAHVTCPNLQQLVERFIDSPEYREICGQGVIREEIIWCYHTLLGREPESDAALLPHAKAKNFKALVEAFTGSNEFKSMLRRAAPRRRAP